MMVVTYMSIGTDLLGPALIARTSGLDHLAFLKFHIFPALQPGHLCTPFIDTDIRPAIPIRIAIWTWKEGVVPPFDISHYWDSLWRDVEQVTDKRLHAVERERVFPVEYFDRLGISTVLSEPPDLQPKRLYSLAVNKGSGTYILLQLVTRPNKQIFPHSSATPGCFAKRLQLQAPGAVESVLHRVCDIRL
jgi:hypothetical protein